MVRMAGKLTGGTIQNSGNLNLQCQPGFSLIRNLRRLQTAMPSVESREQEITRTLKRCSKDTIDAALRYQSTPTDEDLTLIIRGVLSRSLPDEHVAPCRWTVTVAATRAALRTQMWIALRWCRCP